MRHPDAVSVSFLLAVVLLGTFACGEVPVVDDAGDPSPPPAAGPDQDGTTPGETEEEGVVEAGTEEGTAAAELVVEPSTIAADEESIARVENHGEVTLGYGRPIEVERLEGGDWVRWEPADEAVWTMELLTVEPGESGEEQPFPFTEQRPEPGHYRLTKTVFAEVAGAEPPQLTVRARIDVTG